LTQQEAPGYSYNPYVDDGATQPLSDFCVSIGGCFARVDCANVDWSILLVNAAPDGRQVGPANWSVSSGAADLYGIFTPGTAPDIVVAPSAGQLAPGAQELVHISGSYSGGLLFEVSFRDPHAVVGTSVELKCRA